jgi:hypothetical protein
MKLGKKEEPEPVSVADYYEKHLRLAAMHKQTFVRCTI